MGKEDIGYISQRCGSAVIIAGGIIFSAHCECTRSISTYYTAVCTIIGTCVVFIPPNKHSLLETCRNNWFGSRGEKRLKTTWKNGVDPPAKTYQVNENVAVVVSANNY